ncbi:hypothetical protein JCM17844_16180 [Iodidimonas gelatinilytica]|uniref:Uncharacterized protein n=1 Tax=Iodidimonas gelatinilytica TaxID=1236966 RepID=A0A5A7MV76_9PROT|nr:hypothetical protein JCM17844_16180 [Iodidimonas gelatinilytica]GEQ99900.1 hypothetical protein JCM17845_05240 [Iodidimonas gelatinilytica]
MAWEFDGFVTHARFERPLLLQRKIIFQEGYEKMMGLNFSKILMLLFVNILVTIKMINREALLYSFA